MQFRGQNSSKSSNSVNHKYAVYFYLIGAILGATTPGKIGPGNDGNEEVLCIPETSPSDCLVSYPRHLLGGGRFYPFAKMQLVYSKAPNNWVK